METNLGLQQRAPCLKVDRTANWISWAYPHTHLLFANKKYKTYYVKIHHPTEE